MSSLERAALADPAINLALCTFRGVSLDPPWSVGIRTIGSGLDCIIWWWSDPFLQSVINCDELTEKGSFPGVRVPNLKPGTTKPSTQKSLKLGNRYFTFWSSLRVQRNLSVLCGLKLTTCKITVPYFITLSPTLLEHIFTPSRDKPNAQTGWIL